MSQTLTISDDVYVRLKDEAGEQGMDSVERYLEKKYAPTQRLSDEELRLRREAVDRTIALQQHFSKKYGMMPDSAELVREDRER